MYDHLEMVVLRFQSSPSNNHDRYVENSCFITIPWACPVASHRVNFVKFLAGLWSRPMTLNLTTLALREFLYWEMIKFETLIINHNYILTHLLHKLNIRDKIDYLQKSKMRLNVNYVSVKKKTKNNIYLKKEVVQIKSYSVL